MLPTLPLSLSLLGLPPDGLRAQLEWVAACGYRAVQLNAAAADCRPRDLGRSARRDLASVLRRLELTCSGVDLFVPPAHLIAPEHADRAVGAMTAAIEFTADMAALTEGGAVLSVELPPGSDGGDAGAVVRQLSAHADKRGVRIADHAWPAKWGMEGDLRSAPIGVGLDPAAVLLAGADPSKEASRLGPRLAAVRVSDIAASGRVEAGTGRLDLLMYSVSVLTSGFPGAAIVDLRGIKDQAGAAKRTKSAINPGDSPGHTPGYAPGHSPGSRSA